MEHGFQFGGGIEIANLMQKMEVLIKSQARRHLRPQRAPFVADQHVATDQQADGQHQQQGGKQAADAALIELQKRKLPTFDAFKKNCRNQIARNNEKYINADKAAGNKLRECMEKNNGKNGDGAKAVNIWAVIRVEIML